MKSDRSFSKDSLFGSILWVATTLNMSKDTFFRERSTLYQEGFPRPDPLTKSYLKADVMAWIDQRRQVGAKVQDHNGTDEGVNFDAL